MISRVDLHLHSTASDGQFSPSELVAMALERNLLAIAITDHDTTAGIDEALEAARGTGLEVIPGVEISCDLPHEVVPQQMNLLVGKVAADLDSRDDFKPCTSGRLQSLVNPRRRVMISYGNG